MISTIASLLHLPAVDDPQAARRMLADGHALVCEDDVKAVVVKLRQEYDALLAERDELVAALRHVRALLPYLPGSMYAVGRDLADGVLAKYPEAKR